MSVLPYISWIKDIQSEFHLCVGAQFRQKGGKRLQAEMEIYLDVIFTVMNTTWEVLK